MRTRKSTKRHNRLTVEDLLSFPVPGPELSRRTTESAEGPLDLMIHKGQSRVGYSGAGVNLRSAIVRFLATNPPRTRKEILDAYYTPLKSKVSRDLKSLVDDGTVERTSIESGREVYVLKHRGSRRR